MIIKKPIDKVIALFDDPENLKHWQPGLESFTPISGVAGQPGAKSKLLYKIGKSEMEMIETILTRNLPEEFSGTYEAKGMHSTINNSFIALDANTTKYISKSEYKVSGFLKVMAFFMPGMFRKQSQKYMEYFRQFAEKED